MAVIAVQNMRFFKSKGLFPLEKKIKQEFRIDLWLDVSLEGKSDLQLSDTIDYSSVYKSVSEVMSDETDLLEQMAINIKRKLLQEFLNLIKCKVRVTKYPKLEGAVESVYVEVEG